VGGTAFRPLAAVSLPGVNVKIPTPLRSPFSNEYATGLSRTIGTRGAARIDYVFREYKNFYALRTDMSTGRVFDNLGNPFDLSVIENTNTTERRYWGVVSQASYNFTDHISVGGNYTLSHSYGNLEGETIAGGPSGASVGSYPEYKRMSWNAPWGDLLIDQRHRGRLWGTYVMPVPSSYGGITLGLVQQFASGSPYAAIGLINPSPFVQNPGYVTPPTQVEYFLTPRDGVRLEQTTRTDFSLNYSHRLAHAGGPQPELFFHGEVLNVFNQFQLCACGGTVFNNGGANDLQSINQAVRIIAPQFNPFSDAPVQGTNWALQPTFGQPTSTLAFTSPRLFRFSVGVRF
jgi:hypothetical protein